MRLSTADLIGKVTQGDALETLREIDDKSIDLIVIDPPYNIGKDKRWDKYDKDEYVAFMTKVFTESARVLKDNGSFYWFHNDMTQIRSLMDAVDDETPFVFKQFIIWNKRFEGAKLKGYLDGHIAVEGLRNYKQMVEYCLFYVKPDVSGWGETGWEKVKLDVSNFTSLRNYFRDFQKALNLTKKAIIENVGQRADHCFRWSSSQWDLPTEETYNAILELPRDSNFIPREYEDLRQEYEDLRQEYEDLRVELEEKRYTFNNQKTHHSVWDYEVAPKFGHVTPKPVDLIENIIRHSSNEKDIVLDFFGGSGTTGVAAVNLNRRFILVEREPEYVEIANKRIDEALEAKRAFI